MGVKTRGQTLSRQTATTIKSKPVRHGVSFHRPTTKKSARNPMYRRFCKRLHGLHVYTAIKYPLTSESAMKKIENHNTLVFIVEKHSTKSMIKTHIRKLYNIVAKRVNTVICPDGLKKAFVR